MAKERYSCTGDGADNIHISTGDVDQGPTGSIIQVRMVGMGMHGRDNGGDAAGSSDCDLVRIISSCEVRVRVWARWGEEGGGRRLSVDFGRVLSMRWSRMGGRRAGGQGTQGVDEKHG